MRGKRSLEELVWDALALSIKDDSTNGWMTLNQLLSLVNFTDQEASDRHIGLSSLKLVDPVENMLRQLLREGHIETKDDGAIYETEFRITRVVPANPMLDNASREPVVASDRAGIAPASDRIVSLSDNQQSELEGVSSELIAEVEKSNGIDGDPTFRQIVLGQLKAGRELIRVQIFNAELMKLIMVEALKSLIKKYEGHVIGATAATLMELLIKNVLGAD